MEDHGDSGVHGDAGEEAAMSQSELENLQKKNCVFCHIAAGKVQAKRVYEDDECIAVLDINPASTGHMLLMPKEHYTVMFQVPEGILGRIFIIAKGLSQAGLKTFQSGGTTIFAANGVAAGQRAPHFMLHIIPRAAGDSVGLYIPSRAFPEKEAGKLADALAAALGSKKEIKKETIEEPAAVHRQEEQAKESKKAGAAAPEDNGKKADKQADLDSLTEFLTKGGSSGAKGGGK